MTSQDSLTWADKAYFVVATAAAIFTVLTVAAGFVQNRLNSRISESKDRAFSEFRLASETRARELEGAAAAANERAATIEERLLNERRLTARERWRLERVERAVLPRSMYVDWPLLVAELKAGSFHPINVALVGQSAEASQFALDLTIAMQRAGVFGKRIDLSGPPSDTRGNIHSSSGAEMIIGYADGDRLAQMLWQRFQIGGGGISAAALPPAWTSIPTDINCLVVEDNGWALSPGSGQPGEGRDKYGPDPAPH